MKNQLLTLLLIFVCTGISLSQTFVHPGGLHTQEDLDRMKEKVAAGESPWIDGWNELISDWKSSSTYGISGGVLENANQRQNMNRDAQAAYLNALRWYISGDVAHAEKAISIYNAYAHTVNQIPSGGNTDIVGLGGIGFTAMAMGAEIMRLYEGWDPAEFEKFKFMMKEYFYPVTHDFLTNHRGACATHYWANWDLNNISAQIAIGILVDDPDIFNEGIEYFKNGVGAGNIHNAVPFVQGNFGQWQESGRDQSHALLGIGLMANICQLAWNQGMDLYGYDDNRFLKGAEYVARTGALSLEAPFFEEYNSCSNRRHRWVSSNALGKYHDQPVWEIVYNHYVVQQGMEAPHVEAMAQIMRFAKSTNDQLGHGTLTFTLDAASSPSAFTVPPGQPQGLIAKEGIGRVELRWNAAEAMDAKGYTVKRATSPGGPYTTVASWTSRTNPAYTDADVDNGTTYYYVASANNHAGDGPESAEVAATPQEEGQELPMGWTRADIGNLSIEGEASYASVNTGHTFITKGAGSIGGTSDALGFTYGIASGDVTLTARIADFEGVEKTGIMIRESLDPDAKTVLMKIGDGGWRIAGMGARTGTGANMEWIGGNRYTWRPNIWFRISRTGNTFTVYESNNKDVWFEVGSRTIEMGTDVYLGLFNSSGNTTSWNTTRYDHVAITGLDGNAPEAPANLTASPGNTEITLNWDEVTGASSYTLKRSTASEGPYEVVATNLDVTQYTDDGLENGTSYFYVVSAASFSGESADSGEIAAAPELAIAQAPEEVTAKSVSGQQINLSWNESLSATSYHVKRATESGGPYTTIASPDITSFNDTTVGHSSTWYYVVSAVNELGESEDSEEVNATPGQLGYWNFDETEGAAAGDSWGMNDGTLHSGASWTSGVVNNAVQLNGSSSGYVSLPSGIVSEVNDNFTIATWVRLVEVATWARILDFGTSNNNSMFLVPRTSASGEGIRFAIKTSSGYPTLSYNYTWPLDTWTHIAVTLSGDTATMYLNGEPVASSTGFNKRPSDLGITTNNYLGKGQKSDDPMLKGVIDDFRIYNTALSDAEISDMVGDMVPPTPTTILSVTGDGQKVSLNWAASLKVTSYNIKRAAESGGPYTTIGSVTGTSFSDTTLTDDEVYYYVVSSVNENGESAISEEVKSSLSGKTGLWKFDETSGTTAADSWANGDGVLHGDATWSEGIADNSMTLGGGGDHASLPQGLMKSVDDFTIATWVRLDEVAIWSRIFDFGTENNNSMFLAPKTSTSGEGIRFAIKTSSGYPTLSYNHTWQLDTWTHIAVTLSDNTATMYLNGDPVASSTQFTKKPSDLGNTTNNYLGRGQFAHDPKLKGAIDEFKIYNRALSAEEVAEAMKIKQVISFDPLNGKIIGDPSFAVKAHASSDLPVYFTSSDSSVAKVVGDTVHITGVGNTDIVSHQDGDSLYRAAVPVAQNFTVLPLDLIVLHKDGDNGNTSNNSVKPHLQIMSKSEINVAYEDLTVRYWLTPENFAGISTWVDYAELDNDKISMDYVSFPAPREGAYGYIEYGFDTSLGDLLPGADSGPIQSRFANTNWANFEETDDHSFQSNSSYIENEQITLYRNGQLVWGIEPMPVTPELAVKVYSENKNANTGTNTLHTFLKLNNEGNVPVDFKDLSIRYWFTKDSEAELKYRIDYAELDGANISGQFGALNPAVSGADTYFEISIDTTAGTFYPLSDTGEIKYQITKSDWSRFDESDDFSYLPKNPFAENYHITVYYQGELVYGTEPTELKITTVSGGKQVESSDDEDPDKIESLALNVYPNPVSDRLTISLRESLENATLFIHNSLGGLITTGKMIGQEYVLDLSTFPQGIYILTVTNKEKRFITRIVKE